MQSDIKAPYFQIQTEFLCGVPIKKIHWKETLKNLSWNDQETLLEQTVHLPILQKYPLDANYVIRFLRHIIDTLEAQSVEVHDDFYNTLCDLQAKSNDNTEFWYKHYQIWNDKCHRLESIVLKENKNKISQGTTGLNVWESALAISEWAIENRNLFHGKNILELGAGTGLSSLIIGKCCSPKSIHITDGNDLVIENLKENVCNNFEKSDDERFYFNDHSTVICVKNLDWSQTNSKYIETHLKKVDVIIAADVIYDSTLFDSLLSTIRLLFNHCDNCSKFFLVNAVRNPKTEQEFLQKLGEFGCQYHEERIIEPKLLHWERNEFSPIKLYSISNQLNSDIQARPES